MASTVFERAGGFANVRKIVSEFYDRVLEAPRLSRYFENTDMRTLIDHQAKFITQAMGGPASYTDDALRKVHLRLGISQAEFREMTVLLRETLEDFDVDPDDIDHVCHEVERREALIVTRYD